MHFTAACLINYVRTLWTLNIKGLKFMSLSCENLCQEVTMGLFSEDLIRLIAVKIHQFYLLWLFLLAFAVSLCGVCICCNLLVSTFIWLFIMKICCDFSLSTTCLRFIWVGMLKFFSFHFSSSCWSTYSSFFFFFFF